MKLTEFADTLIVRGGLNWIGDGELSDFDISLDQFWNLVTPELSKFEARVPLEKSFEINTLNDTSYDFKQDFNNTGSVRVLPGFTIDSDGADDQIRSYAVAAFDSDGVPIAVTPTMFAKGTSGDVGLSWNSFTGAASYSVFRVTPEDDKGIIGTTTQTTLTDQGNDVEFGILPTVSKGKPPLLVTTAIPLTDSSPFYSMTSRQVYDNMLGVGGGYSGLGQPGHLVENVSVLKPYDVRTGVIYVSQTGRWSVKAYYPYTRHEIRNGDGDLIEVLLPEIDYDQNVFVDLVYYQFVQMAGKNLSSFEYPDLPIKTNGDALIREGIDGYKTTLQLLYDTLNFWDAIDI